jgi:mannan endo-1,4-beta-mannosidase
MKMKILTGAFLILASSHVAAQSFKPVNKGASPEAQKLLGYLYRLRGKHTLSGQHNYNHELNKYMEVAHSLTGKYPAIWGTDFIWGGTKDFGQEIVDEARKKYQEGYIVTLMWHAGRPVDDPPYGWKESIQAELTNEEWKELTTPGTPLHRRWQLQADKVAFYLKQLRDAHVPVLWRPYHEMNGVWFWWGDKKGKEGYQKLWKMLFDRFVNFHRLNNLLWVWNANAPRDVPKDEAFSYRHYYPGRDYVDVLATDVYNFDYEQKDYNELLELADGKLIALGEVGELPKPEILEAQPNWAWFMVWSSWLVTDNTPERVKEVYSRSQTLTHDEVVSPR